MAITSDLTASGATITSSGGIYNILSGATLIVQNAGFVTNGAVISGFGDGPNNSNALPGQSGGTNYPALLVASAGGIASGSTALFGGVGLGVYGGTIAGGSAYDSGSFVAANGGYVSGVSIGSNGGVLASTISGEGGGMGTVLDSHVYAGGYAMAGGGFTIKGQKFAGSGVISKSRFDVGSTEILVSGGSDVGSILGGTQIISSGGSAMASIFSAGTQLIWSGGYASGSIASAGGRIEVYSGGTGLGLQIGSAGSLHVNNGAGVSGVQVLAYGAVTAEQGAVISTAVISAGGTLTLNSGATLAGGTLTKALGEGQAGGLLVLESGAVLSGAMQMGWKSRLDIDGLLYTSGAKITATGSRVTITDAAGNVLWVGNISGTNGIGYHLERDPVDGSMVLVYDNCFLKGTMIRTDRGEVAVEDIVVGDRVLAFVNGKEVARGIIWTGHRATVVRQGLPEDEAGYPVRIKRHALSENIPHKDLLVTPEHAMFLDGAFIPARMLVNGRSIFFDRTITHYDYYHIETDVHSIVWSDGALSESYLDTGGRSAFSMNSPTIRLMNVARRDWASDAAAPLRVDRAFVEPVHVRLAERARGLDLESVASTIQTTDDPDLRLIDPTGRVHRAIRTVNRSHVFMVPADIEAVRIVSRAARPVDMIGPFLDDRRYLGVLVGRIQAWEAGETRCIDAHLQSDDLAGWANREPGECRWTRGDAVLPLANLRPGVIAMLSVEILAGGPYPLVDDAPSTELAAG